MDKPKIIAAGGLLLNGKNELLMIFRLGFWDLPKGKWEEGETIEECAVREVEEETNIHQIELKELVGLTYHEYFNKYTNEDVIKETHWYTMQVNGTPEAIPQTSEDITKAEWIPLNELSLKMENTYPTIKEILAKAGLI